MQANMSVCVASIYLLEPLEVAGTLRPSKHIEFQGKQLGVRGMIFIWLGSNTDKLQLPGLE
jgi:hypothetical protein